jgi:hypothetical protein
LAGTQESTQIVVEVFVALARLLKKATIGLAMTRRVV